VQPWTVTARWIVPVEQPPIARGNLTVGGDRIIALNALGCDKADYDWGDVVLLPGLVNAHTHLDLSGLRSEKLPLHSFTDWLRAVVGYRRRMSPEQIEQDVRWGLQECRRFGTTLVGDIAAGGMSWNALSGANLRALIFYELIGLTADRARAAWEGCESWIDGRPDLPTCRAGISPHAPYSVRRSLLRLAANKCTHRKCPLAIHVGEFSAELELLQNKSGPLADFLRELGAWDPAGLVHGFGEIKAAVDSVPHVAYVHANYLDSREMARHAIVVHCPRTHAAFGHPPFPLANLRQAGIAVALGTDGLGSNPDYNILAEARFLRQRHADVPAEAIVEMATLTGARGLGWNHETGSLAPGKSADFIAVAINGDSSANPCELLLETRGEVQAVVFRGQRAFGTLPVGSSGTS
jgi:cytosine/adenosine deaminase-related metal-dependent hydrolase